MAGFLKKMLALSPAEDNPPTEAVKVSYSAHEVPSDQTTKLDQQTGAPIVSPLDSLEEFISDKSMQVLSWQPGRDDLCVASIPLHREDVDMSGGEGSRGAMDDPCAQKMIVCHDMMGGYVKDKFVQGVRDMSDYYFYHWHRIGAFIYFSHHFVTIPPPTWTNAAHRNGVLSMGTIITEWKDGARICSSLLQDEGKVMHFAQQLVEIARYYGFDGWLINIENPIHFSLLDNLYMLLSLVTTGMHSALPGSKVIWYDSVTTEGVLKWQNMLNALNQPYFDLCDGIFLNYNWTPQGLSQSRILAGERRGEVYVGIDVFGRGCPGGGGFNSYEALRAIHECGLSSALFAPGWVYETQDKSQFFFNQNKFWSLLQPWLIPTPLSSLPIVTAFGRGCGRLLAIDGEVVYLGEWDNHSAQDLQPSFCVEDAIENDDQSAVILESAGLDLTTAYNNGASVKVKGRVRTSTQPLTKPSLLRLFRTYLSLSKPLIISYTHLLPPDEATTSPRCYRYFLQLHTSGTPSRIFLHPFAPPPTPPASGEGGVESSGLVLRECGLPRSREVPSLPGCVLAPLPPPYSHTLHQIYTGRPLTDQDNLWKTNYFVVDVEALRCEYVTGVTVGFYAAGIPGKQPTTPQFSLNIGQIKIMDCETLSSKSQPSIISGIWCQDFTFSSSPSPVASFTLTWHCVPNPLDPVDHCNIYLSTAVMEGGGDGDTPPWRSEYVFLGRSYCCRFRVTDMFLFLPEGEEEGVEFQVCVQPVSVCGCKTPLRHCRSIRLKFKQ